MLASGGVGLVQEGKGVVYPSELGSLVYLPLVVFAGSFRDELPDIVPECLVGVGCVCQLAAYPYFCDFFVSVYSVIYVPGTLRQCFIGFFDLLHSLIGSVDHVAAQLSKLPQVLFGLLLLMRHGPDPDRRVGYFYHLFWCWGLVCDLEQLLGGF